jgi:hypothetical protein
MGALRGLAVVVVVAAVAASPARADPPARRWNALADTMIGVRGYQGGLMDIGYRLALVVGVLTPSVDILVSLDRQLGGDNRVVNAAGDEARWYEWVAAARAGRRFQVAPGLWVLGAGGPALVHAALTSPDGTLRVGRSNLGLEVSAAAVWRSGPVVASVVVGATAVAWSQELDVDGARFSVPARVEPWAGLGVGLVY